MKRGLLRQLVLDMQNRQPVVVLTELETGHQTLLRPDEPDSFATVADAVVDAARTALRQDRSVVVESPSGPVFLHVHAPPPRLVIVGAVHIAQPLSRMASLVGFDVFVVDPRRSYAVQDHFPDAHLVHEWPEPALAKLGLSSRTAVVTLTHDPKLDDPALVSALPSEAFFIGALGSRRTHEARLDRLRDRGIEEASLARLHGPVGIDIGARSPEEIAVSILAKVIQALRENRP